MTPMEAQAIKDWTEIAILGGGFLAFILMGVALEYISFYKSIRKRKRK